MTDPQEFAQPLTFRSDDKTLSVVLPAGWTVAVSVMPPDHNSDLRVDTTLGGVVIVKAGCCEVQA